MLPLDDTKAPSDLELACAPGAILVDCVDPLALFQACDHRVDAAVFKAEVVGDCAEGAVAVADGFDDRPCDAPAGQAGRAPAGGGALGGPALSGKESRGVLAGCVA